MSEGLVVASCGLYLSMADSVSLDVFLFAVKLRGYWDWD